MEVGDLKDAMEKSKENDFEKNDSSDPVVYQLVRVEGDGTLVPATEDEVLQFEHLLHDDKSDLLSIEDVGHVEEFFTNDVTLPKKSDLEVLSEVENTDTCSQKLDADPKEAGLRPLDESVNLSSKCTSEHGQTPTLLNKEQVHNNIAQQDNASTETTKSTVLNDYCSTEKEKADACSRSANDTSATGPSVSGITNSVPDFSLLRGEVCLDNLTIRELQEAFRATFGRQTTVKDKLWLKRRIMMGLANSCDVPSSGCVVKDYKIINKDFKQNIPATEGMPKVELEASSVVRDQVIDPGNDRDSPSSAYYQYEDQQGSSKRIKRTLTEDDEPKESLLDEQCTTKRIRKPTKRFIEELSEIEAQDSNGKFSSPTKKPGHDRALLKPQGTPFTQVGSLSRNVPTREDILGGFSVQVPYVSRMRRGRPRKNFISFLEHKPSVALTEVQTANGMMLEKDGEQGNHIRKARSIFGRVPQLEHVNKEEEYTETIDNKETQDLEMSAANDYSTADANPKIKRAGKRKHHRAWTLCEVLKLVEGVALYGAGRWSEIRRLAFASYSYRTSVDLKDKWRNLIRASLTQLPMEKDGGCPRKSASALPIPSSILLRVRELAELHSQAGDLKTAANKVSGHGRKVVQGNGSGFL